MAAKMRVWVVALAPNRVCSPAKSSRSSTSHQQAISATVGMFAKSAIGDSMMCEGDGDVVGVKAPLRGVAQIVFHGVQVVEVGVQLRVHQDRGLEGRR